MGFRILQFLPDSLQPSCYTCDGPSSTILSMRPLSMRLQSISLGSAALVIAMAGNLFGQEASQQPPEQLRPIPSFGQLFPATRPVRPRRLMLVNPAPLLTVATPALPSFTLRGTPASPPSVRCSVPLSNMQIPPDVNFTMRQQVPVADQSVPLTQATLPAPSCDSPTSSSR
jgi:hypothetical protein